MVQSSFFSIKTLSITGQKVFSVSKAAAIVYEKEVWVAIASRQTPYLYCLIFFEILIYI